MAINTKNPFGSKTDTRMSFLENRLDETLTASAVMRAQPQTIYKAAHKCYPFLQSSTIALLPWIS